MKRVLNTHIRVALQCGSQRKYCSEKKGSSLTAAIDEDMDNIRIHPAEKAPPTAMTMETMMGQGAEADYSALMGKATPRGTELFFTERNVSTDKAWVRTLPGTDLKVSAISMACKRLNHFTGEHIMTLGTCLKSGVNFFDIQGCDSDSVTSFSSMAKEKICTTREISRTNIVVMVRVGWVLFRPWSEINIIAPDFSKIPTSREFGVYGPDTTVPTCVPDLGVSFKTGERNDRHILGTPEDLGDVMNKKFRHYLPGRPSLDIDKINDASLLKLSGLLRVNGKLGHYWTGDPDCLQRGAMDFLGSTGMNYIDILMWDSVHLVSAVCTEDKDVFDFLVAAFTRLETLVLKRVIGRYGIDSHKLWGNKETTNKYLDIRLVLKAAEEAAKRMGYEKHHLELVGFPFNLTERSALLSKIGEGDGTDEGKKSIFQFLKDRNIGCVTSRPLSTYDYKGKEQRYVDHQRAATLKEFEKRLPQIIQGLTMLEMQGDRLLEGTVLRPAPELYHTGRSFIQASKFLDNFYQFDEFITGRYRGILVDCLRSIASSKDTVLETWTSKYRKTNEDLFLVFSQYLKYIHAVKGERMKASIESCLGDHFLGNELAQMAMNSVLSTNLMTSVSCCMRSPLYLDSLISRNTQLLEPLPVAVMGGLFTHSETSFLTCIKDKTYSTTGETPEEIKGKSKEEIEELGKKQAQEAGFSGKLYNLDDPDNLPSFIKEDVPN